MPPWTSSGAPIETTPSVERPTLYVVLNRFSKPR